MNKKTKHIVFVVMLILVDIACVNKPHIPSDEIILAQINDKAITTDQFENAFNYYRRKTGYALEPNSKVKLDILENEFDKLVLAQAAQDLGLDVQEDVIHSNKIIEKQYLIDLFEREFISKPITITEEELRELFVYVNTRVNVSHLYATNLNQAQKLKERIDKGESFESLAKEVFKTSFLANSGGELGEFGFDELDLSFELAAFNANAGDVVGPVKTAQGYSIIKVNSKFTKPIITENEYNTMKASLVVIAERRKLELQKRFHLEKFIQSYKPNDELIRKAWDQLNLVFNKKLEFKNKRDLVLSSLVNQNGKLGIYDDLSIDIQEVLWEFYYSPEMTIERAKDYSTFKNMIVGLSYRVYQLKKVESLSDSIKNEYAPRIKYAQYLNLVKELEQKLKSEIIVPEFEAFEYYQKNRESFVQPLQLDFFRVKTDSKIDAEKALKELSILGEDELSVLKKYGVDNQDLMYQGRTGLKPIQEFGTLGLKLQKLQIGQFSEVFEISNNEFHIYLCKNRLEPKNLTYEESRAQAEEILRNEIYEHKKQALIKKTMKLHVAQIFTEKIQTLALKLN